MEDEIEIFEEEDKQGPEEEGKEVPKLGLTLEFVSVRFLNQFCNACFKPLRPPPPARVVCPGCRLRHYCNIDCMTKDAKEFHYKYECQSLEVLTAGARGISELSDTLLACLRQLGSVYRTYGKREGFADLMTNYYHRRFETFVKNLAANTFATRVYRDLIYAAPLRWAKLPFYVQFSLNFFQLPNPDPFKGTITFKNIVFARAAALDKILKLTTQTDRSFPSTVRAAAQKKSILGQAKLCLQDPKTLARLHRTLLKQDERVLSRTVYLGHCQRVACGAVDYLTSPRKLDYLDNQMPFASLSESRLKLKLAPYDENSRQVVVAENPQIDGLHFPAGIIAARSELTMLDEEEHLVHCSFCLTQIWEGEPFLEIVSPAEGREILERSETQNLDEVDTSAREEAIELSETNPANRIQWENALGIRPNRKLTPEEREKREDDWLRQPPPEALKPSAVAQICTGCHQVAYCSPECRKLHRKEHVESGECKVYVSHAIEKIAAPWRRKVRQEINYTDLNATKQKEYDDEFYFIRSYIRATVRCLLTGQHEKLQALASNFGSFERTQRARARVIASAAIIAINASHPRFLDKIKFSYIVQLVARMMTNALPIHFIEKYYKKAGEKFYNIKTLKQTHSTGFVINIPFSMFDHSCKELTTTNVMAFSVPTIAHSKWPAHLALLSGQDYKFSKPVYIAYIKASELDSSTDDKVAVLNDLARRKSELILHYCFNCKCKRCMQNEEYVGTQEDAIW